MNLSGSDTARIEDITVASFDVDEPVELALRCFDITFDDEIDRAGTTSGSATAR